SLEAMSDADVLEAVPQLVAQAQRAQTAALAMIGELDRRGLWALDGAISTKRWLATHAELSTKEAGQLVKTARSLGAPSAVAVPLEDGELSLPKGCALAGLHTPRTAQAFERDEPDLVDRARELSVDGVVRMARYWKAGADNGVEPAEERHQAHLSQT